MKAVIFDVSKTELARRHALDADRWDEMWEGVLHMTPAPTREHQRIVDDLTEWLRPLVRRTGRGTLWSAINVFRTDDDYRIPDLTFVATGREHVLAEDGIRGGAPDAVIEIRSPNDETYEKLPFFARLGVPEVIVVQRDGKETELYRLAGAQYVAVQPDAEGWLHSPVLGVRLRRAPGPPPTLEIGDPIDPAGRHVV